MIKSYATDFFPFHHLYNNPPSKLFSNYFTFGEICFTVENWIDLLDSIHHLNIMTISKIVTTHSLSCPKHLFELNLLDIFAFYCVGVDFLTQQSILILESMEINGNRGLVPHKLSDFDVQIFQSLFFNHILNNIYIIVD